jgi:extradiol dioxygenase family protein
MYITELDHFVLTVKDIDATVEFYTTVLGMKQVSFGENRQALQFGIQKINLQQQDNKIEPHAAQPTPGSADLCLVTESLWERSLTMYNHAGWQSLQVRCRVQVQPEIFCQSISGIRMAISSKSPTIQGNDPAR